MEGSGVVKRIVQHGEKYAIHFLVESLDEKRDNTLMYVYKYKLYNISVIISAKINT